MHAPRQRYSRVSLDQLMNVLSQRREKILKENDHSTMWHNQQEQAGSIMTDPSETAILSDQLELSSDAVFDEISKVPFMNFKRRSEIRSTKGENVTDPYVVSGNEELVGKEKRRKLVRPSLNEECENLNDTSREYIELGNENPSPKPTPSSEAENVTDSSRNHIELENENPSSKSTPSSEAENVTDSSRNHIELENENPAPKPYPSSEAEDVMDSSRNRVKEICNKNLRWFLERRL